jgi:hypothetical protein
MRSSGSYGRDSGCCEGSHFPRASRFQHPRTRLQRRPSRRHIIYEHDDAIAYDWLGSPRELEHAAHVAVTLRSGQGSLCGCSLHPPQRFHDRQSKSPREIVRLIEAACQAAKRMKRDGD